MKKFFAEFKTFIKKGNVVDLAVALVIGTAFNKIVSSLVNDIIMPLVSLMVGGKDVTDWKWIIQKAQYDTNGNVIVAETALKYGMFIQTIIDFLIIAMTVFIIIKIFKASTEKLVKIGKTIINETKELTQKQIKALKRLQKKATKQAKKEGKSVDQVLSAKTNEIETITGENTKSETQTEQTEGSLPEQSSTVTNDKVEDLQISGQSDSQDKNLDKNDEILLVLKEIRDNLKNK